MRQTQLWILMKVKAVIGIAWAQSSQRNLHDCVCKLILDLIVFTNEEIKDHPILQRTTQAHDQEGHRESVCVDELLNALTAHEPWLKLWWNWQQPLTRTESPMSGFHQEFRFKLTWMYEGKVINECMATHVWCMHNNYKGISTGLPDGLHWPTEASELHQVKDVKGSLKENGGVCLGLAGGSEEHILLMFKAARRTHRCTSSGPRTANNWKDTPILTESSCSPCCSVGKLTQREAATYTLTFKAHRCDWKSYLPNSDRSVIVHSLSCHPCADESSCSS